MVHISRLLFRTVLVAWGDVFIILVGSFSGILGIALVSLFVVKFWSSICRGENLLLNSKWMSLDFLFLSRVFFPAFVYVCVCVCVCVFLLLRLLASSICKTSLTYLRCTNQRSFVVSIARGFCQVPSSPFPNLSHFSSKDVTPSRQKTEEKTIWYTCSAKRWYILIEDIRQPRAKPSSYEKIRKIRRLL